jgi:tetratricopeptide (TPR) repeat protein
LNEVLKQPGLFDQTLLTNYISEIIRFVRNTGLGFEFGTAFIDRIMTVYREAGYPLTELYLAKARFIPIEAHEHIERERVFLEARRYVEDVHDQEGLARILLTLSEYYTGISQYKQSIRCCQECEQLLLGNTHLLKYYPTILVNLGINYFLLLDSKKTRYYLLRAKELLEKEELRQHERGDQYFGIRILATVLHYLGRDALRRGDVHSTMEYYVQGHQYQQLGSEDLDAIAFYHLRIAELLVSASLLDYARDHLYMSQEITNKIVIAGTALEQISSAWASIYDKEGDYKSAQESMQEAIKEAKRRNIYRVEQLCLARLLLFELRHLRLLRALYVVFQILKSMRGGELRENGIFSFVRALRLVQQFQIPLHMLLGRARKEAPLLACTCPIHQPIALLSNAGQEFHS